MLPFATRSKLGLSSNTGLQYKRSRFMEPESSCGREKQGKTDKLEKMALPEKPTMDH